MIETKKRLLYNINEVFYKNLKRGSIMKLSNRASVATQKYMVDGIRYVCENFKERAPGTTAKEKLRNT